MLLLAPSAARAQEVTIPAPGANLAASTTFQWTNSIPTVRTRLLIGTTGASSSNIYTSPWQAAGVTSHAVVVALPTTSVVYVTMQEEYPTFIFTPGPFVYNTDLDEDGVKDELEIAAHRGNPALPGTKKVRVGDDYTLTVLGSDRVVSLEAPALFATTVSAVDADKMRPITTRILKEFQDKFDFIFVSSNRTSNGGVTVLL